MSKLEVIKVFIASPSDLAEERALFPEIIKQVNTLKARSMDCLFEAMGWEDTLLDWGRAQGLINEDVRQCDIFVMLLWKRWGQSTGKSTSGTEEEFNIAYERYEKTGNPQLLLYFRSVPQAMMADPGKQLQQIIKFKAKIEKHRICLFKTYDGKEQWAELIKEHLSRWLDKKKRGIGYTIEGEGEITYPLLDTEKRILNLQQELETARSLLRAEALRYAVEAAELVEDGKLTFAEERYAKSVELYPDPGVLNDFGRLLSQIGSSDRANEIFKRVLSLSSHDKDRIHQVNAYINLGNMYMFEDELDQADEMYKQAVEMDDALGRKSSIANAYVNLGSAYVIKGNLDRADAMYNQALTLDDSLSHKANIAKFYLSLGNFYMTRGDLDRAKELWSKAGELRGERKPF
ncbi:MAG: tetratricopeptide repeat protein [Pyrinomonadaceae bacterium]